MTAPPLENGRRALIYARFSLALKLLQSQETPGVGARNLVECLALQLKSRQAERGVCADDQ